MIKHRYQIMRGMVKQRRERERERHTHTQLYKVMEVPTLLYGSENWVKIKC
jgi:hypothetical protein